GYPRAISSGEFGLIHRYSAALQQKLGYLISRAAKDKDVHVTIVTLADEDLRKFQTMKACGLTSSNAEIKEEEESGKETYERRTKALNERLAALITKGSALGTQRFRRLT